MKLGAVIAMAGAALACRTSSLDTKDATAVGGAGGLDAGAAADAGGAATDALDAVDTSADAGPPPTVFRLSDTYGVHLQVASDRTGRPVVLWEDQDGHVDSAFWDPVAASWVPLEPFDGAQPLLIQPNGSGQPLMKWETNSSGGGVDKAVRRFDPGSAAWGALVDVPGPPSVDVEWQLAVDGQGNAHSFWRGSVTTNFWSWWRAGGAAWEPAASIDDLYQLVMSPADTFMWRGGNDLGVRRFDAAAGAWSDAVVLADLTKESILSVHQLVIGRDGGPLMTSERRDPDQLVLEAWRGQAGTNSWGARTEVESIPVTGDPNSLDGSNGVIADPAHDFIWVAIQSAVGDYETHVSRFDPADGAWTVSRVFHAATDAQLDLRADGAGRAYGYVQNGMLTRFDPRAPGWQDTMAGIGSGIIRTSDDGAFVVGFTNGDELTTLRSDAGSEWRPARGYPGGAHLSGGSVDFAMEIAGPERAIVVWTLSFGPDAGVWAAFLE
jgi:hypothetical protein